MQFIFFVSFMALNSCNQGVGPLPECHLTELDSTSHSFAWTITELGDGGGSILRDVAIVNDTLVYAVGEIRLKDSLGNWDSEPYGLAIWNGQSWRLKRIYPRYPGFQNPPPVRATGIFLFSATDVWFTDGTVWHWDGVSDTTSWRSGPFPSPDAGAKKLWGTSGSNLYAVGDGGTAAHYDGTSWQRLQTGTTLPIRDIWGAEDRFSGQQQILAVASGSSPEEGKKLLSIKGTTVTHLPDEGLSWSLSGVWFVPNCRYYVVGAGIHQKPSLLDGVWSVYDPGEVTSYASSAVYGRGLNDIFVAGSFLEVVHFNGSTWYNYRNEIPFSDGVIADVDMKGNSVFLVGQLNQRAVAIIGRR